MVGGGVVGASAVVAGAVVGGAVVGPVVLATVLVGGAVASLGDRIFRKRGKPASSVCVGDAYSPKFHNVTDSSLGAVVVDVNGCVVGAEVAVVVVVSP